MIGYDIDGTLIDQYEHTSSTQRRNYFIIAKPYFIPDRDFILITARGNSNIMRSITEQWALFSLGDNYKGCYLLNGFKNRTAIKKHKTDVIRTHNITEYSDDDEDLLEYIKQHCPDTQCYLMKLGKIIKIIE